MREVENLRPNDGLCVFCGLPYANAHWAYGNNPEPLIDYEDGRACDMCNATVVIPARLNTMNIPKDLPGVPDDPSGLDGV